MQKMGIALILIVLGLIVIAFPALGLVPAALLSGFFVLMVGIGLILAGIHKMGQSEGAGLGIFFLILGITALILVIGFIFIPALVAWLVGFIVWIIGLLLIMEGIARILSKRTETSCGAKDIILGILILLAGLFLATYTWLLGVLIGLWLLTTGMRIIYNERWKG